MPLVDYSSESDPESDSASTSAPDATTDPRPRKKPRLSSSPPQSGLGPDPQPGPGPGTGPDPTPHRNQAPLPPLPASFYDLYASTVRTSTRDDPTLHQGRTRQTPHIPGNWPSHIYIEWHPPPEVHTLLASLVSSLQKQQHHSASNLAKGKSDRGKPAPNPATTTSADGDGKGEDEEEEEQKAADDEKEKITSFLVSPLGAPQPLHISLSRPLSLPGTEKDAFLRDVQARIAGVLFSSHSPPLSLFCNGVVEWHRTPESGRSFLVLRVRPSTSDNRHNPNPELTELLRRCNAVAAAYGQPELYSWAAESGDDDDRNGGGDRKIGEAFHVSIAWSFAEPSEELRRVTEQVFGEKGVRERIEQVQIPVDGVKVKIGNTVTHVPLPQPGRRASGKGSRNLLGL